MGLGAFSAVIGGLLFLLALAVWLAFRLKKKNQQLKKALTELERRSTENQAVPSQESAPVVVPVKPPLVRVVKSQAVPLADAFLWEHLSDQFLWKHLSQDDPANDKPSPIELIASDPVSGPTGLCQRALLEPFFEADPAFTGLVVLVGIAKSRASRHDHPAEPFVEELLGPTDFACRHGDDEFLIVCPGLRDANAQRRLNEISERLWNFQLQGQGSFSVLFSWGGIGVENEPLSHAIASATERMQQTKRSRVLLFRRKAG